LIENTPARVVWYFADADIAMALTQLLFLGTSVTHFAD